MSTYIMVPAAQAEDNYAMLNNSTQHSLDDVRKQVVDSVVTYYMFEAKTDPPAPVFEPYQWCTKEQAVAGMESDGNWV